MMSLADAPPLPLARDSISLSDLLGRVSCRLEDTAALIAAVEASLGILIHEVPRLSPDLIRDLQKIDLARQTICDISRVLRLAAAEQYPTPVSAPAIATVIQLRDLAEHLLRPHPVSNPASETDRDNISWF